MIIRKNGQIGAEYLIVMGFLIFVIIGILGFAVFFSGNIKNSIVISQSSNFAEKVISAAETVYYQGEPSKATINAYLPSEVESIQIIEDMLVFSINTNNGLVVISFPSNVPIQGELNAYPGTNNIVLTAYEGFTNISHY